MVTAFFLHPQNDQVAAQRFTSEEKRALERIQEDMYSDFRRAAEAHRYNTLPVLYQMEGVSAAYPCLQDSIATTSLATFIHWCNYCGSATRAYRAANGGLICPWPSLAC